MLRRTLLGLVVALAATLAASAAALSWLVTTQAGSAWLLGRVPGLTVVQPQGRLFGGSWSAARLEWAGARRVVIERPGWRDLRWQWHPRADTWLALEVDAPRADRVVVGNSRDTTPLQAPASLQLPVTFAALHLAIDALEIDGLGSLREVRVDRLHLGDDRGRRHRLQGLSAQSSRAALQGELEIATEAPFELAAQATARSRDDAATPWQAAVRARGPLAGPQLRGELRSSRTAGATLEADAKLAPFAAWPLDSLVLSARAVDLAALFDGAPLTRLSGRAEVEAASAGTPLRVRVRLSNATAGRWDERRLPLAALDAELTGSLQERQRVEVRRFEARLAGDGGRISGDGQWHGAQARLVLNLTDVRPAAIDRRAAALALGGRLELQAQGLPAPDGSVALAAQQSLGVRAELQGRIEGLRADPVRAVARASLTRDAKAWRAEVGEFELRAGAARALTQGRAEGTRSGAWQLTASGTLAQFDPSVWWADLRAGGPTQLDGRWQIDLRAPATPRDLQAVQAVRGSALVELAPSRWAGVPLQGRLALDGREPGWGVQAELSAATNRATLEGRLMPAGADDRWQIALDAPAPAALTPLWRAVRPPAGADAWWPGAGRASARLQARGRWPALRLEGEALAEGWQAPSLQAKRLRMQGGAGPDAVAPLGLTVEGEAVVLADRLRIERIDARLDGSLAAHRLVLDAASTLRPPAWVDTLAGSSGDGSRVAVAADGRWSADTWRGELQSLEWRARGATGAPPWLAVQNARAELRFDTQGLPVAAQAEPGRALLLGAPVQWRQARWQAATSGQASRYELDLALEPLGLSPWLQRAWPQAGLAGDLALRGTARVQAGERFAADIVLERAAGDLSYRDEDGSVQPFGLTDLRLAVAADEGTWHFTQAVAGTQVGVLAGAQSLRVDPRQRWPAADTPMEGVLEWRVADLGAWARFTPPGWRVAGTLRTSAALGGRFGAPEVQGEMVGSGLAVRNLLQGVDVHDGELALSLRGAQARIERFVFRAGDGTLRLSGGATLGATPNASLLLEAERFRLLGRVDRRLVTSGRAELQLAPQLLALDGRFTVDEGLIDFSRADAPSLDDDVRVRGGRWKVTEDEAVGARRPTGAPRELKVALQVNLGRDLKLRGRGLDTRLGGQLTVSAPSGRPAVHGSVRTEDGTYAAYGQKLDIERGQLEFRGAVENPRLDIVAIRPNLDVRVGVQVSGSALAPRVRLVSEPEMSEFDKLSWLVLGRASDGLARTDTALLQRAALALLAGEERGNDLALLGNLGLDEFSVRQRESGDVRETVVTVGKQLSRRWYVGYERGVNQATGTWQLIYRVAQRFTLRARSGEDSALDAIWTWRWN